MATASTYVATGVADTTDSPKTPGASDASPKKSRPEWLKALIPGLLAMVICGLFAAAYMWPMSQMDPKNISVAIAGPEEQVA